jgi:hypothetical protein
MIEEQVEIERLVTHLERYLRPDKGEAAAEFQQQVAEMDEQTMLELSLLEIMGQR